MSLMRFLTSGGRGFSKGVPPMGRYRLPDGRMIPEFGRAKNPFTPKTLPPQETESPGVGVTARAASTQAAPPSSVSLTARVRLRCRRSADLLAALWRGAVRRMRGAVLGGFRRAGQGIAGLRARSSLSGHRPTPFARSMTAAPGRPVQGELTLENVQVVRNDLTETDYEVVCAETATASPVKRPPQTVPVVPVSRPLGRLAERLFSQRSR